MFLVFLSVFVCIFNIVAIQNLGKYSVKSKIKILRCAADQFYVFFGLIHPLLVELISYAYVAMLLTGDHYSYLYAGGLQRDQFTDLTQ
jgi:hypothetical protein